MCACVCVSVSAPLLMPNVHVQDVGKGRDATDT